jgi:hypothetical protein
MIQAKARDKKAGDDGSFCVAPGGMILFSPYLMHMRQS